MAINISSSQVDWELKVSRGVGCVGNGRKEKTCGVGEGDRESRGCDL